MQGERRVTQQRDCRALTAGLEVLLKLWKGLDKDTLHKGHQLAVWSKELRERLEPGSHG